MKKKKLPRGIRKHIRREKALIRKEAANKKEEEEKIKELLMRYENKRNI